MGSLVEHHARQQALYRRVRCDVLDLIAVCGPQTVYEVWERAMPHVGCYENVRRRLRELTKGLEATLLPVERPEPLRDVSTHTSAGVRKTSGYLRYDLTAYGRRALEDYYHELEHSASIENDSHNQEASL